MSAIEPAPRESLSPAAEAWLFWRLRGAIARALLRQALRTARLRVAVLVVLSAAFWLGLFGLFWEGFHFLNTYLPHPGLRLQLVQGVYNVFFLTLSVMLLFSSAIILYGGLYRGEEAAFLMTLPARDERVVLHKYWEAVLFGGWGFVLLGTPMLAAYGVEFHAPWYYYALLAPFLLSFVVIPTSLGVIVCMLVVAWAPRLRAHALGVVAALVFAAAVYGGWSLWGLPSDVVSTEWVEGVVGRMDRLQQRFLPSWWLGAGLLNAAHPQTLPSGRAAWLESLALLGVLAANALLAHWLVEVVGARCFRRGHSALQGLGDSQRKIGLALVDRLAAACAAMFPRDMRVIMIKDFRLFRRDPVQWSQFLIFFGLLGLYFINTRKFDYSEALGNWPQWMTAVGFLNVAVIGLLQSTFTTRFIYPLISLEGRRFWILGVLPIRRDTILWGKFLFSCGASWPMCAALTLASDAMLGVLDRTPGFALAHQALVLVLSLGLSALAVGLGARFPDFRETSPSKIASGFGGTLNLVLSALFILCTVGAVAVPCFCWMEDLALGAPTMVVAGAAAAALLGAAAVLAPLWLGLRAFRALEF